MDNENDQWADIGISSAPEGQRPRSQAEVQKVIAEFSNTDEASAGETVSENLGIPVEEFLGNVDTYLGQLKELLAKEGTGSLLAINNIMEVVTKVLTADEIVLSDVTREKLEQMKAMNAEHSNAIRNRAKKAEEARNRRWLGKNR